MSTTGFVIPRISASEAQLVKLPVPTTFFTINCVQGIIDKQKFMATSLYNWLEQSHDIEWDKKRFIQFLKEFVM